MCVSAKFVPKEILKINRIPLKSKPRKQQRELGVSADYTPPLPPPLLRPVCVYGSMATNQKFRLMRDHFHEVFAACPVEKSGRSSLEQAGKQRDRQTGRQPH